MLSLTSYGGYTLVCMSSKKNKGTNHKHIIQKEKKMVDMYISVVQD